MTFEEVLLEAIDDGFSLLGETGKLAVYFYLEDNYNISKHDIPDKIESFTEALEAIFGYGAKLLEINIMKNLFQQMGYVSLKLQFHEDLDFSKYVDAARTKTECPATLVTCMQ